ncbi:hypothetical protein CBM2634_P140004 [Cupriavidus taiwanensis]|uniref:Uncharacterized protein n=1 Tax=Cupriavidus taiwanensis TaxID=164546 RepID=A0A375JDJ2_9BURK|nr:hypothetical protein CBM2634_P140004 [Cupriavidus taiwanensis]
MVRTAANESDVRRHMFSCMPTESMHLAARATRAAGYTGVDKREKMNGKTVKW